MKEKKWLYNDNGFTLIELLVVVALAVILASVSIPIYGNWHMSVELDQTEARIVNTLRLAREQSVAGLQDSFYGVNFQNDRFSFTQVSPSVGTTTIREEVINSSLQVVNTLPSHEIYFSRASGTPDRTGLLNIIWADQIRTIEINSLGMVEKK